MANIILFVDNVNGSDTGIPGAIDPLGSQRNPVATADKAFSLLPAYWDGSAEIRFLVTSDPSYRITAGAVYFGMPIGPRASPLVIRGGYRDQLVVTARGGTGDYIDTTTSLGGDDELIGAVLTRLTRHSEESTANGTAISIRGNERNASDGTWRILLQRSMGRIDPDDTFAVQKPAVTLAPAQTLNLISHDGRSLNLTLIGIRIAPAEGKGLNLINVRAQCDTCEFSFRRPFGPDTDPVTFFVHTNSRIQGGGDANRAQAGVYIKSNDPSNGVWAVRGGILGGHLTFKTITAKTSQGGTFVPQSLEALEAPIRIMTGGAALAEVKRQGAVVFTGWGTETNKARIRNVAGDDGDGLRVLNGASMNSPAGPVHLNISNCQRDGIRLDGGSSASFGLPGGEAGLVTIGAPNGRFGMNIRDGSRALVGSDAATATVPGAPGPTPLNGATGEVGLDDTEIHRGWALVSVRSRSNERLSLVSVNT